jgi:hypothetical protein
MEFVEGGTEVSVSPDDTRDEGVLEIQISVEMEREAAEMVQLEAVRLLAQQGLRVKAVTVTRPAASETDEDSAEAT